MKKLAFSLFILLAFNTMLFAQFAKSTKYVGGSFSISGSNINSGRTTSTNVGIEPAFGYFLTDKLSAGLALGLGNSTVKNNPPNNATNNFNVSIGPFLREHFGISGPFSIFIEEKLGFGFGTSITKSPGNPDSKVNTSGIDFMASPGIIYFPVSKVGVETGFGSLSYQMQKTGNTKVTSYGLNVNLDTFYLGLRYYF